LRALVLLHVECLPCRSEFLVLSVLARLLLTFIFFIIELCITYSGEANRKFGQSGPALVTCAMCGTRRAGFVEGLGLGGVKPLGQKGNPPIKYKICAGGSRLNTLNLLITTPNFTFFYRLGIDSLLKLWDLLL